MSQTTRESQIQEAAKYISAKSIGSGKWVYHADETDEDWQVTADELVDLYRLMHHEDEEIRGSAYSRWCTTSGELVS